MRCGHIGNASHHYAIGVVASIVDAEMTQRVISTSEIH
jgi:hypothetical protein